MFAELLRAKLAGICELSEPQVERLREHYEVLTRWNKVLSLTSVRTLEESVERHYCESVFAAYHLPEASVSVADVGSGAGFPGIPIAIVRPEEGGVSEGSVAGPGERARGGRTRGGRGGALRLGGFSRGAVLGYCRCAKEVGAKCRIVDWGSAGCRPRRV